MLVCFWAIGILIVGVEGDFPLNDDWSYARGVKSLVEAGRLELDTWPAMTLISQVGVGFVYGKLFGFSFEVLRWATLINAWLGLWLSYRLLLRFTGPGVALFAALLLWFNPWYFSLSFTFMTEVHFTLFLLAVFLSFFKYLETRHSAYLALATLFSVLVTLLRQPGLIAPLACGLALVAHERRWKFALLVALPFTISFVALQGYYSYLDINHPQLNRVGSFGDLIDSLQNKGSVDFLRSGLNLVLTPAVSLLPLVLLLIPTVGRLRKLWVVLGLALTGMAAYCLLQTTWLWPLGNVFYNLGLGPRPLRGSFQLVTDYHLSDFWWEALDYLALGATLGVVLLGLRTLPELRRSFYKDHPLADRGTKRWMLLLFCGGYFVISLLVLWPFDRHTVPLFPLLAALVVCRRDGFSRLTSLPAVGCLLGFALFSTAATHDYLSWNRARKEADDYLSGAAGVPPYFIDAGVEINGWKKAGPEESYMEGKMFFVSDDDYVLALRDIEEYDRLKSFPFSTWLPPGRDELYILRKTLARPLVAADFPLRSDFEAEGQDGHLQYPATGRSTERAYSGKFAYRLSPAEGSHRLATKLWDPLPGGRYTVSAWCSPAGASVTVVGSLDYGGSLVGQPQSVTATDPDGWERITAHFTVPDYPGANRLTLGIELTDTLDVWLDDLRIDLLTN